MFARRFLVWCASLAVTSALLAQSPSALDGFNPDVDGNVLALATQADGRVIVGGQFTTIGGVPRSNLARLNADGSVDTSFDPRPNGPVRALLLQNDGRILIGGDFSRLQPGGGAELEHSCIARLNADGSVDAAFAPQIGGEPLPGGGTLRPQVFALALQPDGAILVGGAFASVQPGRATVIIPRRNLLRVNAAGGIDLGFDPNPNGMVLALAPHVDNKILVGGGFTSLWPAGDAGPSTRNRIARLNANGTVDSEFNPNANNGVTTLAVQRDGKILLGGFFTTLQPIGDESAASRAHLARLNVNGTLDSEFFPRAEGNVARVAVQPDGAILVGGSFNAVWGRGGSSVSRSFVARFLADGSLDGGFNPALNGPVEAFAFQPDGKIVLGGQFTRALPQGGITAVIRNHLARLNPDGSLDASFELDPGGRILVSVTQADGRIVVGGSFTSIGGATRNFLARLNADGTVDPAYHPDLNGRVYAMAYEAGSNKVIIGGAFTTVGGETRNHIARLNPNGTIDSEFNPNIDGQVGVILLQPDGRILVGGSFNSVHPIGASSATARANLLRLNANGTLDTAFDPSPNSSVSALALQSDQKILVGGTFSTLAPGFAANTSAQFFSRNFLARLNADGTLDTAFATAANGQVSAIAVQSDGKIILGGAFSGVAEPNATQLTPRSRIARLNADGTIDTAYDPSANGNVLALALQPDGRLLVGGSFTTLQPNGRADWILRKYAARLNADGTVDESFDLDLNELPGNRVDSLRLQADGRVLIGGSFTSLQPAGTAARIERRNFARLNPNGSVDTSFDPNAAGSTSAIVNGLALQPDGRVIAVGNFSDLGGAKSTNIARFRPEGTPDPDFSGALSTDGPVHAVVVRPNVAAAATQLNGFTWLNANGTLRTAFAATTRLSGDVTAIAVDASGRLLLGGAFANLGNTTAGNLVRFNANGSLDASFNPAPNGQVTGIVVQPDGRIVIVGSFTLVGGTTRNRIARINDDGTLDTTYDPNANARINAIVPDTDGRVVVGGAFTSFTPNLATAPVTRNYLARVNNDGTLDTTYDPNANAAVNALAVQPDGKVIAGGAFTALAPNGATTATTRSAIARLNPDGSLDQNFDPNANGEVAALLALPNGQIVLGGAFTTLQPGQTGAVHARNYLARVNSDGAVDTGFNPNPNAAVTALAQQPNGAVLVGGAFTTLQPGATGALVTRNRLARVTPTGALDLDFNPDLNGSISALATRPDGSVLIAGNFSELQLLGSIVVGGNFATVGGVPARNLAMLNSNGSVNTTFQPRPDGAVNALLVQPDGKLVAGGAFANIAGAARSRLARFNADGTLDPAFNPALGGTVSALALQSDGRILVGLTPNESAPRLVARLNADGSVDASFTGPGLAAGASQAVTGLAVQQDGRVLVLTRVQITGNANHTLSRLNADGSADASFAPVVFNSGASPAALTLQADGRILVAGAFTTANGAAIARVARIGPDGTPDASFNVGANGPVTALALQPDGRLMVGGTFTRIGGQTRVGLARLAAGSPATQMLGVSANRSTITWNRGGSTGELSAVIFEISTDRATWTRLGEGARVPGTSNWQLTGQNLPASGVFYLRARGLVPTSAGTSSGIHELVREFNFTNPVPVGGAATTPATAAARAIFDPFTGIAARATLLAVPGEGVVEIVAATAAPDSGSARLANLSTRGRVTADNPLLLGFAIAGSEPRRVLVRAVGPGLAGFGVTDALPAARLQIYDANGALIAANDGWGGSAALVQTAAATGAFPLAPGSADSAAVLSLAPGTYTLQVVDARGAGGVALAEIYDAGSGAGSRLVNVSSRAAAGSGSAALISGFVIAGDGPQRVLLRGVGPGLVRFHAGNVVTDPALALFDSLGQPLGANDNWVSSTPQIAAAAAGSGAFALEPGSKDAAVLATLPAGAYTTQVSANETGTALLEIYEVR